MTRQGEVKEGTMEDKARTIKGHGGDKRMKGESHGRDKGGTKERRTRGETKGEQFGGTRGRTREGQGGRTKGGQGRDTGRDKGGTKEGAAWKKGGRGRTLWGN